MVSRPSPHRAASGPTALFRNTKAAGAAIGGVKNMLLEWCRAMTRNYEVGTGWGYRRDRGHLSPGQVCNGESRGPDSKGWQKQSPGSLRSFVPCPSTSARGHPELLLQLEQRHGLLRPHPQVFPRRLRLCRAGPSKAPAQLHASLLDCRVSPSPGMAESGGKWVVSVESRGAHRMGNQPCI